MQLRNTLLVIATAGVLGAGVFLLIEVGTQPEVQIPAQALAEARQRHQRAEARTAPSLPSEPSGPPWGMRPETRPESGDDDQRRDMAARFQTSRNRNEAKLEALAARQGVSVEPVRPPEPGAPEELKDRMVQANKLYDRADYESALAQAQELLQESPDNVRMLRVAVSSACITGQEDLARQYYARLPEHDRKQMSKRCERYGVEL